MSLLFWCHTELYYVQAYVYILGQEPHQEAHHAPGGKLCLSFSAFSGSSTESVYKYREHRTLNLVCTFPDAVLAAIFLIRASDIRQVSMQSKYKYGGKRTGSILPPCDLDELLDIPDFLRLIREHNQ